MPQGQDIPAGTSSNGPPVVPPAKNRPKRSPAPPGPWHQLVVFLIAADLVVILIYFLLVPSDVWESSNARMRSVGSLLASGIAYLGLKSVVQKYVARFAFLEQTWFRAIVFCVTPVLWAAILPIWSVRLDVRPPQVGPTEVLIIGQTRSTVAANSKESQTASRLRLCEETGPGSTSSKSTVCVLGQLSLRTYEIQVKEAPHSTYLPVASIFAKTLTRDTFRVQLPCKLHVWPVYPQERIFTKRIGENEEDRGILPEDGIVLLMPGRYEFIRAAAGKRGAQNSLGMECHPGVEDQVELSFE